MLKTRQELATIEQPLIEIGNFTDSSIVEKLEEYSKIIAARYGKKYRIHIGDQTVYLAFFWDDLYTGRGLLGHDVIPDTLGEMEEIEMTIRSFLSVGQDSHIPQKMDVK